MNYAKKVVLAVILLAIAVVAVIFGLRHMRTGAEKPPTWLEAQIVERIDEKTLTVVSKSNKEWEQLGRENGRYKNPESGEYSMVSVGLCGACGGKIPQPPVADPSILVNTRCPLCGKNPLAANVSSKRR